MRHRPSASQDWRDQQQQGRYQQDGHQPRDRSYPPHVAPSSHNMQRSVTEPTYHQPRPAPPAPMDSYYSGYDDASYGPYSGDADARSTYSHTALNIDYSEKYQQPPVPAMAYGSPSLPPSSPQMQYQQGVPPSPVSPSYAPYDPRQYQAYYAAPPPPSSFVPQRAFYSPETRRLLERQRRGREKKERVALVDGHLRLDLDVPRSLKRLINVGGTDMREESGKLRYTAVTDDPDLYTHKRYRLRQVHAQRSTELFICMTMYNEDEVLFCRTMTSVIKNIAHLQSRAKSKTWGPESWKKVVVCIVSDGRAKINPRTLKILGLYGVYQDGVAKDTVDGKDVTAHVFEYTSQVVVDAQGTVSAGIAPVQIIFCLKEQNKKKLNSHRWAFNAFCTQLRPNVCVLLDVGTRPGGSSIYSLWKEFDKHSGIGGACGEITVDTGRGCSNLINPLVAAQNFEYKMSNILDKPLESVFGYISVLPGAFSAYRYKALLGAPLQTYFAGEKMHESNNTQIVSMADANAYLAEDRILCFEIATKKNEAWSLRYVKSAKASTDVPNTVAEFISQRRRWTNGSLFAAIHSSIHYYRLLTSGQGILTMLWMSLLFLFNFIQLLFQLISLSSMYLAIVFIAQSATSDPDNDPFGGIGPDVVSVAQNVYVALLGITVVCALGNKPAGSKWWYLIIMFGFATLFGIALYCTVWTIYLAVPHTLEGWKNFDELLKQSGFRDIALSIASTYGLYIISSILHYDPYHLVTCFIQYMFLLPSYVNVINIYSMSNTHDLAWGTKGSTTVKDLGAAGSKRKDEKGNEVVEVDIPTAPDDIDELWLAMKKEVSVPAQIKHEKRSIDSKQADRFATLRTNGLIVYLGVNMAISIFFTSEAWTRFLASHSSSGTVTVNWYMAFIFWSNCGLAAFRFIGSTLYLILRLIGL